MSEREQTIFNNIIHNDLWYSITDDIFYESRTNMINCTSSYTVYLSAWWQCLRNKQDVVKRHSHFLFETHHGIRTYSIQIKTYSKNTPSTLCRVIKELKFGQPGKKIKLLGLSIPVYDIPQSCWTRRLISVHTVCLFQTHEKVLSLTYSNRRDMLKNWTVQIFRVNTFRMVT